MENTLKTTAAVKQRKYVSNVRVNNESNGPNTTPCAYEVATEKGDKNKTTKLVGKDGALDQPLYECIDVSVHHY